ISNGDADYITRMEMLFTINPQPHPSTNDNTNVESFSLFPIPNQESDPHQEEIDVVAITNNVLPPSVENDDLDEEVDDVDVLRVDNLSEDSDFDNPSLPLPPSNHQLKDLILRMKFQLRGVRLSSLNEFSLLSAESEDTIFDPGIFD
nr:hypothetical protein [Tanacetum cinerariifolium]GFB40213.1 hypothetical protein [Tanacetum cinerariifolium]